MEVKSKIVALTSSKGGVGKTHLAVNLSVAMVRKRARVLLIDADLGNGIISDRLGLSPRYNLVHFFSKEKALEDLIEKTPYGFFLIGGEKGHFSLANLNYLQTMRFLRNFIRISRGFDFVVLDLASGISRQVIDFALLAEKTVVVASPNDLMSAYGSVRACFSRFIQLESRFCKKVEGYRARRFFRPLILINNVIDFQQGEKAFEALTTAVDRTLYDPACPFRVEMDYLGAVFQDHGLFRKSEERRSPVSVISVYSKVAFCIESIGSVIFTPVSSNGFETEKRLRYIIQILMEQQARLKKELRQKVTKMCPVTASFRPRKESISP